MDTSNNDNSLKTLLVTYTINNDINNLKSLINENDNIDLNVLIPWDSENEKVVENSETKEKYNIDSPIYYTTLLNLASIKGNVEIVEILLEHGALPTVRDGRGRYCIILYYINVMHYIFFI